MRTVGLAVIGAVLAGCTLLQPQVRPVPGVDPAMENAPIGPTLELGRGESLGMRWRYLVWESRLGTCTSIDFGEGGGSSCGGEIGAQPGGAAVRLSGMGSGTGMPTTIEGFATDDVTAVVIVTDDGERVPATLVSLAPAGAVGQAFIAIVPADRSPSRVVGLDANGVEIGFEQIHGL